MLRSEEPAASASRWTSDTSGRLERHEEHRALRLGREHLGPIVGCRVELHLTEASRHIDDETLHYVPRTEHSGVAHAGNRSGLPGAENLTVPLCSASPSTVALKHWPLALWNTTTPSGRM